MSSPSPDSLPIPHANYKPWTEAERTKALIVFAETSSISAAALSIGAPHSTIRYWIADPDAKEEIDRLRTALKACVAWQYIENAVLAAKLTHKRMLEGDPYVNSIGQITYAPVKAKDLALIASVCTDKALALAGAMQSGQEINGALDKLANALLAKVERKLAKNDETKQSVSLPAVEASGLMG